MGRALLSAHAHAMLMLDHFPAGRTVNSPSDGWRVGEGRWTEGGRACCECRNLMQYSARLA